MHYCHNYFLETRKELLDKLIYIICPYPTKGCDMKFLHLFHKEVEFGNIEGYDDIKDIVRRVLDAEENYNLIFIGPPASSRTLFLLGILESTKGVYFDGSNTTNRILDVLEQKRPKIICIDEVDKMSRQFQNRLLNFMCM
jgi:DNA polymerase III delta prime subunit